jgi:hypothetical protein
MSDLLERLRDMDEPLRERERLDAAADIERLKAARSLVEEQAKDEGLWFRAETCAEAYVQQALRKLHAAIEGVSPEECARRATRRTATWGDGHAAGGPLHRWIRTR